MVIPFLVVSDLLSGEPRGSLDSGDDGSFITHEDLLLFWGRKRGVRGARQRIRVAMQGAFSVLNGEVKAGKNFEPAEDHPGR